MKANRAVAFLSFALFAALISAGAANASRIPRIELLRDIRVSGANVLLSDLLPTDAPVLLRKRASKIALGAAPELGNTRTLEQGVLEARISASPGMLSEIVVPGRVTVSREVRLIALPEVFDAICQSLQRDGADEWTRLRPEDILLQSQVLVSPGDAGLRVLRADVDAGLRRARFLLWPSKDPGVLPFIVTARLDPDSPKDAARVRAWITRKSNASGPDLLTASSAPQEILVSTGKQATLFLHSDVLRVIADVMPLERGTLGQRIRVRMLETGKIFSAQVDGRAHLDLKF